MDYDGREKKKGLLNTILHPNSKIKLYGNISVSEMFEIEN